MSIGTNAVQRCICLAIGLALMPALTSAAELTLVAEGRPNAVLIVEAEAPKSQQAAEALRTYIEKMSGATLPMVAEGEALPADAPPVRVHVGHTAAAQGQNVPSGFDLSVRPDVFEEEGYVLRTLDADTLLVAGNNDGPYNGTVFAAYALLEELGCRWYFPGEWGEIVPERTTIVVRALDIESRPDFAVRGIGLYGRTSAGAGLAYGEWALKMRFVDRGRFYPIAGDDSLARLVPPGQYFDDHPEWFAMNRAGERVRGRMLCLSNREMQQEAVRNARAMLEDSHGLGISPPDGAPYCFCPDCQAASANFSWPRYGFPHPSMSEEYADFVRLLALEFPDKYIGLSAYSLREFPPQGVELPPNVSVLIWPITSCVLHAGDDPRCWRRLETMRITEGWLQRTPHVVFSGYTPGFLSSWGAGHRAFLPERDVVNFAAEAPLLKEMGAKGVFAQGGPAFMQSWLSYYARSRLMWDVNTDVQALKRDFYDTFFGPEAGPHVQAWWDACEVALGECTAHVHEDWLVNHVYDAEFTRSLRPHVDAAREAAMTDEQRARFDAFALMAEYLEFYGAMNDAEMNLDYERAIGYAVRMGENLGRLSDMYDMFFREIGRDRTPTRERELRDVAARIDGTAGELVAPLPLEMKFTRDPFNEGLLAGWYAPGFDDADWGLKNTYYTWDQQDEPETEAGHDYLGYGWYRAEFGVGPEFDGRTVKLFCGGAINEAWVWVNGEYVGHRPHVIWWRSAGFPKRLEMDVSPMIRPGRRNTVAIRILNDMEVGGLFGRGFFFAPVEAPEE